MKLNVFDCNSSVVSAMKNSHNVYIFGAGELGRDVGLYLQRLGVVIAGYTVDDKLYISNQKIVLNDDKASEYDVVKLSECLDFLKANGFLIWGMASPSKLKEALSEEYIPEAWITYDVCYMWKDNLFAHKHEEKFRETRALLEDELSRKTFDAYLKIYDGNVLDDVENLTDGIYFNELTQENRKQGCFVDGGGYTGDTAMKYARIYGMEQKIYAFEPDSANFRRLIENTKELNIVPVNAGCWSKSTTLHFDERRDSGSNILENGSTEIKVTSIDEVIGEDKVSFIKLDVEGSELETLIGASKIIKRDMPVLAISAYHKQEDLITLPQYIHQFETKQEYYQLYLRHHGCAVPELVLYGIPVKK